MISPCRGGGRGATTVRGRTAETPVPEGWIVLAGASVAACGSCRIRFGEDVLVGEWSRDGLLVAVEPPEPVFADPVVGGNAFRRIGAQGEYVPADGVASVVGEFGPGRSQ